MGNLKNNWQTESEGTGMDRPLILNQANARPAIFFAASLRIAIPWALALQTGCASMNIFKKEDDEYKRARNAIEGFEDKEGNWIRPEGIRADKSRNSNVPKALHFIPGLGPPMVNKEVAKSTYLEADELFKKASKLPNGTERQASFRDAAKKYNQAGKNWVSSALEQDAFFMTGESYFFSEDYPKAEDFFVKLLKEYPRTRYQDLVDKRRMEIGLFWLQFNDEFYHLNVSDNRKPWNDTRKHGVRVLEKMRLDNPIGRLADDVTMELANTSFKKKNWNDALDTYNDLISTYPDSPHQFDAHLLGVKAALMSYQGADYSDDPLEKAEKMLKQLPRQFRDKAEGERQQIETAMKEVHYRRAEREYTTALYRYNKSEARAAQLHSMRILEKYSDTPFYEKAVAIMEKTGGMPPEPQQQLSWLADWFPNRDKITPLVKPTPNVEELDKELRSKYERTATKNGTSAAPPSSEETIRR